MDIDVYRNSLRTVLELFRAIHNRNSTGLPRPGYVSLRIDQSPTTEGIESMSRLVQTQRRQDRSPHDYGLMNIPISINTKCGAKKHCMDGILR